MIGGGVVGCSVAYHLAKLGWTDVVLLERKRLTSGTTWHAAGLITQLRVSANMTRLAKYSQELYGQLESETGVATGFVRSGSISISLNEERSEELRRTASLARAFGVEVEEITASEVAEKYPFVKTDDVVSGVYLPKDGQGDPANIAMALAKGARIRGVQIFENVKVTGFKHNGRRVVAVHCQSDSGTHTIQSETVVNCAGMWAREVGRKAGVNVPLHACEHFYIVTEPIKGLTRLPSLRVPDECSYFKEDAGKLLMGAFEPNAKPWGMDGIPENFEFDQLPEDFDQFEPILESATERVPILQSAGINTFFNGPESFTPDNAYLLGQSPELDNFYVAAGFNSIGIQSAGGAGMALAQWIEDGVRPFDLGDVDVARMQPFQSNRSYLYSRSKETLGLLYADHFPYRQKSTARGVLRSPVHNQLLQQGAVMGELAGWERANWYAEPNQLPEYQYSWKRQNWFENWQSEHQAVRRVAGLYDMSSFGKILVQGRDAEAFLNRVCGANLSVAVGRIVYTQFLNSRGCIEADVTVARLTEQEYLVVTPAATRVADQAWMRRRVGDQHVTLANVTASEAVLALMGPDSRNILTRFSPDDFSSEGFPFGTCRKIEIGMAEARAHRISYVGELGWEIYISTEMAAHVFETLLEAVQDKSLKLCGMHMMDSCRIEKGFRHFGHDITCEDHVLEAGLGFAVDMDKPDFEGRDAVMRKKESGLEQRLVQFILKDSEPLLYHNETILRDGEIVGHLTSGSYGHHFGAAIGLGYVPCKGETGEKLLSSTFQIEVGGDLIAAEPSLRPLYDPKAKRMRS